MRNIEARLCNHCYRGKAISITYSEYVSVTLVIQHAKRMYPIMSSVACQVVLTFPHYVINGTIFGNKGY